MKPASEWDINDLAAMIGAEESSNLEFKDGRSLLNETEKKHEIAKDVSAMANAAGGTIIYGLHASDSVATEIAGCDASPGKLEWFDQIITNNIEPKVQGVRLKRIDLPDGKLALVVTIPPATTFAPHQSKPHHRYFRRYERTILPMLDHEIRDIMRRATSPELYIRHVFLPLDSVEDGYSMRVLIGNKSKEPALYTRVDLILEQVIAPFTPPAGWEMTEVDIAEGDLKGFAYSRSFIVPHSMPIMEERDAVIFEAEVIVSNNMRYAMGYDVTAPGFRGSELLYAYRLNSEKVTVEAG